ncbi:MAG TPA: hypothetical protein VML75_29280 [Kofleriaceae bacterium]|nr:hypothetical protein [Kofleriaceae bacterium]
MMRAIASIALGLLVSFGGVTWAAPGGEGEGEGEGEGDPKTPIRVAEVPAFPADPAGVAEAGVEEGSIVPAVAIDGDTWFELHGYARMPISVQMTPREPFLVDNDYYLSGFAYTRLYEPDWSEIFLSAHHKNFRVKFGLFASLYSDYASPELENQFGIAQASVAADEFLDLDPLSVELGVFWDRYGYIEPYDTYVFGRTHQGGVKARWAFSEKVYVQAGAGAHQEQLQQNQGLTPVVHVAGGAPLGPVMAGGYVLKSWTRDKRQLSPIQDGDLLVLGVDGTYELPRGYGKAYAALSYARASQVLFLAPAVELLHSTGGRGLTENFLGRDSSDNGTGSLLTLAVDAPTRLTDRIDARVFGMATWVRSNQVDDMNPMANKDRRMYLKWGAEPMYRVRDGLHAGLRYDRVIMDLYDAENSFRVLSPKLSFPLDRWGELVVMYSHYFYGDKIQLRPGQVPLETMPDSDVFKVQAQAVW